MACDHQCLTQEWKSISTPQMDKEILNGCFDCNICLEFAHDPIVTLCGHLYCWPCIYKWLHFQSSSLPPDEPPQCPVCKSDISHATMVPLYARGQSPPPVPEPDKTHFLGIAIPPRPPPCATDLLTPTPSSRQQLPYRNPYQIPHLQTQARDDSPESVSQPGFGMFGEMIYARVFGNSESMYTMGYPNSYRLVGSSSSPRLRRQEMHANKSLNRISIFLLCCFVLFLLLF